MRRAGGARFHARYNIHAEHPHHAPFPADEKKPASVRAGQRTYEDSSSDQLASTIGRIAVRRDQQRHVVVLLRLIDAKAQHNNI